MKADHTEIVFILDRSGSMESMRAEAVAGFNAFVAKQQAETGTANLSLVLFDHEYTPVFASLPLADVQPLVPTAYEPRGMTALLDAIGRTTNELGARLSAMPEEDRPDTVIVVVLTDGLENASQNFSFEQVGAMIKHQEDVYSWQYIFLGASLQSLKEAKRMNFKDDSSVLYAPTGVGMTQSFTHTSQMVAERRKKKQQFPS
jgi:uncharacterized protein YegL